MDATVSRTASERARVVLLLDRALAGTQLAREVRMGQTALNPEVGENPAG